MSNLAIRNSVPAQTLSAAKPVQAPQKEQSSSLSQKIDALKEDSVNIKSGLKPSLLGAGAAAAATTVGSFAAVAGLDAAYNMGSGALALLGIPMIAIPVGAISGGVVANVTDDKTTGTALGGGVGAALGGAAALALGGGNLGIAAWGAGIGAAAGATSGFIGSLIAERK